MKILASSDFHGFLPTNVPECDLFLIGGDICPLWSHHRDMQKSWMRSDFQDWLANIPAKHVIGVAGNHDFITQDYNGFGHTIRGWEYLEDQTTEIDGLVIHGTPWTPLYGKWAWMQPDNLLNSKWEMIPEETDILLVHGPPYMTLDRVLGPGNKIMVDGVETYQKYVGSKSLLDHIADRLTNLKAVVCGHIHEGYGVLAMADGPTIYNVAHMDRSYDPVNKIVEIEIP